MTTSSLLLGLVSASVLAAGAAGAQGLAADDPAVAAARATFIDRMVDAHDFDRADLTDLLASAVIDPMVLERISRPVERVVPWYEYRQIFLTPDRIESGARFWSEHAEALESAAADFGVAPEIILAIIGVESRYGERMGTYRVLDALATLAFAYPPRARFFGSELEQFLLTARREGPGHLDVLGSYAGAMGAGQFISSSYEAYAVDTDGDGHRDLWSSWPDIFGSVANYFARHGWREGEAVAVPTGRADGSGGSLAENLDLDTSVGALRAEGFEIDAAFADTTPAVRIGLESGPEAVEEWIGFNNFRVITRYNRSAKYALAVLQLSQAIARAHGTSSEKDQ